MITLQDWRTAATEDLEPLYDAECARWYGLLGWDYRPTCGLIEAARTAGRLRGLLAHDRFGKPVGWTYFLTHQDSLQIGNLVAGDDRVAHALLRAVVSGAEAKRARRLSCFLFPRGDAVERALSSHGFSLLPHTYLRQALRPNAAWERDGMRFAAGGYVVRDWAVHTIPELVRLFCSAYEGTRESRCFAPDGGVEQWSLYLHHLVHTPACGRFEAALSALVETDEQRLAGAVLVTALSDRTAHIAQMSVAAGQRRRGVGSSLVILACERAREARYEEMTLLVAESNDRARRLYDRLGFEPVAKFLYADRTKSQAILSSR